jgi:hypothetical protein
MGFVLSKVPTVVKSNQANKKPHQGVYKQKKIDYNTCSILEMIFFDDANSFLI